ncbi:M48 family metalloprotease [Pseudomonas aeruginosa]|uniref:M48 family metalloprotease n=1 Tax=Pseudomonas aeruginosa TaxID=287 RepID=UPI0035261AAC
MKCHWLYLGGAFGLMFAGQGMAVVFSSPLPLLIGLVLGIACALMWIFHATDPDPAHLRAAVSDEEATTATDRLRWVDQTIADLASVAQIKPLRTAKFANAGIYYKPLWHRVNISRALLARLSDADLRLILAHEIGHATRRFATWGSLRESSRIAEEIRADAMALRLTGDSKDDWLRAMRAALRAENINGSPREIAARLAALGIPSTSQRLMI